MQHFGKIRAGCKRSIASAGDGNHSYLIICCCYPDGVLQFIQSRKGDGVVLVRPIDRDEGHRPAQFVEDVGVVHD